MTENHELYFSRVLESVLYTMGDSAGLQNLSPRTRLLEDLRFDSVAMIELLLNMEEEFGCSLDITSARDLSDLAVIGLATVRLGSH